MPGRLLTTVVTDSPHGADVSHAMLVDTLASLALVPGLERNVRLVFDGAPVPKASAGYHWKCKAPADEAAYAAYKAAVRTDVAQLPAARAIGALTVVDLPYRVCLAGAVRVGVVNATTPFVAVIQNDLPLRRTFDLHGLLTVMRANADVVHKVSFSAGYNHCYLRAAVTICKQHRHLRYASNTTAVAADIALSPAQFWFDGNHVATAAHYQRVFTMRSARGHLMPDGGFMENFLFCHPWLNHAYWGTYLLGNASDGRYSSHANARNLTFRANPCMIP